MKRIGGVAALVASALLLAASVASAATVTSGIAGSARLCTDAACTNATLNLTGTSGPVTGSFTINIATLQLEFDLTLASAMLSGSDTGMTSLVLENLRYQGTANIAIIAAADTNGTALPNLWTITSGNASVTGGLLPNGLLPAVQISVSNVAVGGGCQQVAGGSVCGPIFNPFAVVINDQTRYLTTTLNVAAPEPAVLGLLGLGLATLAGLRFRRS
jgi:hypothetical protein